MLFQTGIFFVSSSVAKGGATVHYFQLNPESGLVFPTVAVNGRVIGDPSGMFGGDPESPGSFESFQKSKAGGSWLAFDYSASYSQRSGGNCEYAEHGAPHVNTFGRSSLGWFPVDNQRFWRAGSKDPHYSDATILVISPAGGVLSGVKGDTEWIFGDDGEPAVSLGTKAPYLLLVIPHWTPPRDFSAGYLRRIVELYYTHHGITPQHALPGHVRSFDVWTWDLTKYSRQWQPAPSGSSMGKAGGGKGRAPLPLV